METRRDEVESEADISRVEYKKRDRVRRGDDADEDGRRESKRRLVCGWRRVWSARVLAWLIKNVRILRSGRVIQALTPKVKIYLIARTKGSNVL